MTASTSEWETEAALKTLERWVGHYGSKQSDAGRAIAFLRTRYERLDKAVNEDDPALLRSAHEREDELRAKVERQAQELAELRAKVEKQEAALREIAGVESIVLSQGFAYAKHFQALALAALGDNEKP